MFGNQFPAFKLVRNCYLHYDIKIFFLKTANLIINWLLSDVTSHRTQRPPSTSPFDQILRQGDKNLKKTLGSFKTYVHLKLQIFDLLPLVHPCSFYMKDAYEFFGVNN